MRFGDNHNFVIYFSCSDCGLASCFVYIKHGYHHRKCHGMAIFSEVSSWFHYRWPCRHMTVLLGRLPQTPALVLLHFPFRHGLLIENELMYMYTMCFICQELIRKISVLCKECSISLSVCDVVTMAFTIVLDTCTLNILYPHNIYTWITHYADFLLVIINVAYN